MNRIRCLFLDVDGTLTDGKIHIAAGGELFKSFDVKDGYGISRLLPQHGIEPIIVTARNSRIVDKRCLELGIRHCYQGITDKLEWVSSYLTGELKLSWDEAAYMGDDLADLPCMNRCAVKGCPADAVEDVKRVCDFVSGKNGGHGAVREFIEWLIGQDVILGKNSFSCTAEKGGLYG